MKTALDIIKRVRFIAAHNPDFVYNNGEGVCSNLVGGDPENPGCIVGRAVRDCGYEIDFHCRHTGIEALAELLEIPNSGAEVNWLFEVQHEQDRHISWSHAVARADSKYGHIGKATTAEEQPQ